MAKIDNKFPVYKDAHKNEGACLGDILTGSMANKEQVHYLMLAHRRLVQREALDWKGRLDQNRHSQGRVHDAVFFNPMHVSIAPAVAIRSHDLMAEFVKLKEKAEAIGREFKDGQLVRKDMDSIRTSYNEYMTALDKQGFKVLGSGAYGTVYFHPKKPDRAVKVSRDAHCEWPYYVQWANSLKVNMGPKLYSLKFHNGFYVAVMERVAVDDHSKRHVAGPFGEYRHSNKNMRSNDTLDGFKKNAGIHWCNKRWPHMIAFLRLLQKHSMSNDLHNGNWGVREDGSVCIFDPTTTVPNKIKKRFPKQRVRTYE